MTEDGAVAVGDAGARRELTVARIAQLAGVSPPTVSKVIHGRAGVASRTRQRIEQVIREHGYQRQAGPEAAPIVEVVFQALDSLWALEIVRGVESVVQALGQAVTVTGLQGELTPPPQWGQRVLVRRPVGVIGVSVRFTEAQHALLRSRAIPLVALDPSGEPAHPGASVGATNWNGGLAAARHLAGLGHRRIAMINGPGDYLCCRAREDGFRAGLDVAGVPLRPGLLRVAPLYVEGALPAARELLRLPEPPTAVFTANDLQALGVYEAAREAGLRIPGELSVVGFDDLPFVRWMGPPLTTVRQPLMGMGAAAARLTVDLAAGRAPDADRVELPTSLVVRASTAPPRTA